MRAKKLFLSILIAVFSLLFLTNNYAFATVTPPGFPSCVNPPGTVIADFSSGTHGVVGVVTSFQGTDKVYAVSDGILIQCLCPENGDGIQTNWWKIPSLTSEEIENFKSQGWVFIPDGSVWGLDPAAYLAINQSFSCKPSGGGGGVGGVSGAVSSVGQILGLAVTGNIKTIYTLVVIGFLSLTLGFLLKKRNS
ncbi:hypothetical protein HY357_00310 [Candidatus Roizmanbacteria bacterium]|nr:hypothetical protein [Candidatus Roizmanbacteria bacterium]